MYKYLIAELPSGAVVYVNLINSPAGHYLSRRPYLMNIVKEVVQGAKLTTKISIERDMGRVIGTTDIVETTEKDIIYYAMPIKKSNFSRFAKNRYPQPSAKLTIFLEKDDTGSYELLDTWIGPCSPPFPGDDKATSGSRLYWETHALAQDAHPVQSKTITKVCPY
jgi:hypothetical protein